MTETMDVFQIISDLQKIPLFAEMDYSQLDTVCKTGELRQVQPEEVLCEAMTVDERLIVFLQGKLRLESEKGRYLSALEPIRVIGEMGVFTEQARATRVVVEEESTVMFLGSDIWDELLEKDLDIGIKMQSGFSRQVSTESQRDSISGIIFGTTLRKIAFPSETDCRLTVQSITCINRWRKGSYYHAFRCAQLVIADGCLTFDPT